MPLDLQNVNIYFVTKLEEIIKAIEGGAVVVTVNKRLARYLSASFETAMVARGCVSWTTPVVMPLGSWARSLLQESWQAGRPALITEARAVALWKKIIEEDHQLEASDLLVAGGAWQAASSAYALMKEYCLQGLGEEIYLGKEALAFKRWSRSYEKALKQLGFIDFSELIRIAGEAVTGGDLVLPDKVVFAGFDEITPQRAAFMQILERAGLVLASWPSEPSVTGDEGLLSVGPAGIGGQTELRSFKGPVQEVKGAALWIREVLASSEKQLIGGGGMRIGVIVPELGEYRDIILREFGAELSPVSVLPWKESTDVFNLSLGAALSTEPIISALLDILTIVLWPEDITKMSGMLLSPYICETWQEGLELAAIDADLKRKKYLTVGLRDIRGMASGRGESLRAFTSRIDLWIEDLDKAKTSALPSAWAERFSSLLAKIGFFGGWSARANSPAKTGLTSREYQCLESWKGLLAEFAGLGDILGAISRRAATSWLRAMAAEKIFQVESVVADSVGDVSVEVLGMLEASGQDFDYIWLMGAYDGVLPGPASPNPFIPIELQRRFGMPRATPEKMLGFATGSLKRIFQSAGSFVVSYPMDIRGKEVGLSPLLNWVEKEAQKHEDKDSVGQVAALLGSGSTLKAAVHKACALEDMAKDGDIGLSNLGAAALRGGTSIIKDQSECPFRAFAKHRLGASGVVQPEDGLDGAERGNLVHQALEFFWKEVKDSERLRALKGSGELEAMVEQAVTQALRGYYARRLPRRFLDMEGERVVALVRQWLEVELKRSPFTVVQTEFDEKVTIGGLSIVARPDRLDELENGARVVIDYKTGNCTKNAWLPDKMVEPQMLLYGIGTEFDAIAFASLKLPGTKFIGLSKDDGILPNVKSLDKETRWREQIEGVEDWDDLREMWRQTLSRLAEDFVAGICNVSPTRDARGKPTACLYCELPILCRIFELDSESPDESEVAEYG